MTFAKALVAPIVSFILVFLQTFGITPGMTVEEALYTIVAGLFIGVMTYIVPNKQ